MVEIYLSLFPLNRINNIVANNNKSGEEWEQEYRIEWIWERIVSFHFSHDLILSTHLFVQGNLFVFILILSFYVSSFISLWFSPYCSFSSASWTTESRFLICHFARSPETQRWNNEPTTKIKCDERIISYTRVAICWICHGSWESMLMIFKQTLN